MVTQEDIVARLTILREEMKKTNDAIQALTTDAAHKTDMITANNKLLEEINRLQQQLAIAPK